MTTRNIERLVTAALREEAEDAMRSTDTKEELRSFLEAGERDTAGRRRLRVAGAVAAVAAAVLVAVMVLRMDGGNGAAPPVGKPTVEKPTASERVATGFLRALADFDRARAATFVAPGAELTFGGVMDDSGEDTWTRRNRWDEATGWKVTGLECREASVGSKSTDVRCSFAADQLGSDRLRRGPFGGNTLTVTVRDGAVDHATLVTAHDRNGFSDTMWDPFWAWMSKAHAGDEPRMAAVDDPGANAAQVDASLQLWQQRVRQYVDAVRTGTAR